MGSSREGGGVVTRGLSIMGLRQWLQSVVVILTCLSGMSVSAGPVGLFVQLSTLPMDDGGRKARVWFDALCEHNRTRPSDERIGSLVLQQTADEEGSLYVRQLRLVEEYFSCVDTVYFGTAHKNWHGQGSQYVEGIGDDAFRQANIGLSNRVADQLATRYRSLPFAWYVNYEANLNFLTVDEKDFRGSRGDLLISAYQDFLSRVSGHMRSLRQADVLWSPTFWSRGGALSEVQMNRLQAAISRLLTGAGDLTEIHFQDFVGQSSYVTCEDLAKCDAVVHRTLRCHDVIEYFRLLNGAKSGTNVRNIAVNLEMFTTKKDRRGKVIGLIPEFAGDLSDRIDCYQRHGVPLGASWEIRWWHASLFLPNRTVPQRGR